MISWIESLHILVKSFGLSLPPKIIIINVPEISEHPSYAVYFHLCLHPFLRQMNNFIVPLK